MHRTNIYLTERQIEKLQKDAGRLGISVAELIRRIIDKYLDHKKEKPTDG